MRSLEHITATNKSPSKPGNLRKVIPASIVLSVIAFSQTANAGAWVPEEGRGYSKLAYTSYKADEVFGENDNFEEFLGRDFSYYGEYGLGNNFGIFGTVLFQDPEQTDALGNTVSSTGFSDVELGVRYQWQANPFVLSTSFTAKLPYLYDEHDDLPRGNGQEDFEFRVLAGRGLNEYGYFGIEAGYRVRTDAPSDEIRYLIEYGFSVNDNLYLRTKLDGTKSAGNADKVSGTAASNLSLTPEFDIGKLELTSGWTFGSSQNKSRWGVEFTYTKEIYGKDALKGNSYQFGITKVF